MSDGEANFPECCGYCPHQQRFSAGCDHELRQSLITELATSSEPSCPVYDNWRSQEMAQLEDNLSELIR